jgi:hypothetical protein
MLCLEAGLCLRPSFDRIGLDRLCNAFDVMAAEFAELEPIA